jgi:serine/threonine protein kinase
MTPDPVTTDNRPEGDFNVTQVWLDALARGTCDEEAFLRAVQMLTRRSPEAAWDSLALLDQYFRRGKIKPEVFKRVKSRLGSQLLGPALDVQLSVPLKRHENQHAPAAVVVPVPSAAGATTAPVATAPAATAAAAPTPAAPAAAATPVAPLAAARAAAASAPAPAPSTPPVVTPAPSPPSAPLTAAYPPAPEPAPAPIRDMAAPQVTSVPPPRAAVYAAPAAAASAASGRTVPIGIESTSIPVLNPATRPIEQARRGSARQVIVGDVLRGRYVIKNILGLGGTGTVFEAIDHYRLDLPDSGQRVAVKVLHADTTEQSAVLTDLRREFQLLQSLSHPNIVRAHEYDRDGDTAFFTMEYLSGLSLESVLSAHREVVLERAHALIIIRDVAAALEHAHSRGVVHGDLNPGNIFITNEGGIRVLDFGAAHTPSETPSMTETPWDATAYATLRYASCQLLDGERADARDDTYALACVLYVLLAGKHPFGELNAAQARAQRLKPRRPAGLSGKQWHALRTGLSFDRQRRPADIVAWLEPFDLPKPEARLPVLLALLKVVPRRSGGSGVAVLIVVVLALAAAALWASANMDLVSQTAQGAGGYLKDGLATADAALTRLWERGRTALSSSPAPETQPPGAGSAEPPSAAPEVGPSTARPAEAPSRATSPSVAATAPAARIASPRTPIPAMTAPASSVGVPPRSSPAAPPSHSKIELTADTVDVPLTDPAAHVIVKRTGNLHADTSFTWWTESGTAKPGQDFMGVKAHEEHFEDGKAVANLFVPVVADPTRKQPKSFYIVINDPSDGASLGKRTLTMVTITPAD